MKKEWTIFDWVCFWICFICMVGTLICAGFSVYYAVQTDRIVSEFKARAE